MTSQTTVLDPNRGHGHVRPRPDGVKARCGGPGLCVVCARELVGTSIHPMQQVDSPPIAPLTPGAPDHWIQTLPRLGERVGGCVDLIDPTPSMIDFRVIAAASSRVPRFAGHTGGGVLSTAQHQTEGARAILRDTGRRDAAAAYSIHDAHEAYVGDIATPIARALAAHATKGFGTSLGGAIVANSIKSLKATLDRAIYAAAGIAWPLSPDVVAIVKLYDVRMGRTERDARLAEPPHAWEPLWEQAEPVADVDVYPWSTGLAEAFYWQTMQELLPVFARSNNC